MLKSSGESMGEMSLLAKNPKDVTHVESVFAEVTKLAVVSTLDVAAFRTIIGAHRALRVQVLVLAQWRFCPRIGLDVRDELRLSQSF